MAPTICLPELSMQQKRGPSSYNTRCRENSTALNNGVTKDHERRLGAKRLQIFRKTDNHELDSFSPPASPIWEPAFPRNSAHLSDHWRSILARREGLLDIVARTMVLVRRNHMLQKRVNALRTETRDFIRSVMSNPENNGKQDQEFEEMECGVGPEDTVVVSSSSEAFFSGPTPPPTPDSSTSREILHGDESDYCDIADAPSFSSPVNSPLSIASLESESGSDYSYDYPDSPSCRITQDPKVSSS